MKTNTHLLNLVTQILEVKTRQQTEKPGEFTKNSQDLLRLKMAAIEEIQMRGKPPADTASGYAVTIVAAEQKLDQILDFFTINS